MKKSKFYAVRIGRNQGVYRSWDECQTQVNGYKGAIFKGFKTFEEAKRFVNMGSDNVGFGEGVPFAIASTDGSFSDEVRAYSYGCVMESPSGERCEFSGIGTDKELIGSRNIAGEVLAVMKSVEHAYKQGYTNLLIRHDYEGIARWATGDWSANALVSKKYVEYLASYKELVNIRFEKVKAHSGDERNERSDALASEALDKVNPYYMELDEIPV